MGGIKRQGLLKEERRHQPATLADLRSQGVEVFCWCNRCSHNAIIELAALLPLLGPHCPVPEIGARLVCSACGSKDVATRPAWKGRGEVTGSYPPPLAVPAEAGLAEEAAAEAESEAG